MDIGSLTGAVSIEDQLSDRLMLMSDKVKKFAEEFDGAIGGLAVGVGIAVTAVIGMALSIEELGKEGSKILGVENAFDHLAASANTTGAALRESLSEGVKSTVTEFQLMESTTKLLGSGMKLTTDQASLMGSAARELGKATGGDAASGLSIMSTALVTGRVRGLQQQIGLIDLAAGEQKFAASIGTTVDQLNAAGQLEGKRIAILDATKAYVDRLGVSELSFAEKIKQGQVAVSEWSENLAKSVATSKDVNAALDAVGKALSDAFGAGNKTLMDLIVSGINAFARGVTEAVPYVVDFAKAIGDTAKTLYDYRIVIEAGVAALLLYNFAVPIATTVTAFLTGNLTLAALAQGEFAMASGLAGIAVQGAMTSAMGAVKALWAVLAANPIIAVTAAIGALTVAFVQWRVSAAEAELATQTLGAKQDVINKALADGAPKAISYADAIAYNNESFRKAHGGAMELSAALQDLQGNSGNTHSQLIELNNSVLDLANKGTLTTPLINQVSAAIKAMKIPADELPPALKAIMDSAKNMATGTNDAFLKIGENAKKAATALESSITKTEGLWETYFGLLAKEDGDSLGSKLSAIDRWFDKEFATLEKSKNLNANYYNELDALTAVHLEKIAEAEQAFHIASIKESEKEGEQGAAAVAKGFAGMPLVLMGLSQSMDNVRLSATNVSMQGALIGDAYTEAGKAVAGAMTSAAEKFIPLNVAQQKVVDGMRELGMTTDQIAATGVAHIEQLRAKTDNYGAALTLLADNFIRMGQAMGGAVGAIFAGAGQIAVGLDNAHKSTTQLSKDYTGLGESGHELGGSFGPISTMFNDNASSTQKMAAGIQTAAAIYEGANAVWDATANHATAAGNALGGMAAGAQAGASFGPWGMAIGAAAGLVVGIIRGKPDWAKAADEVAADFGVKISNELAKTIAKEAKDVFGGSEQASAISHLSDIIKEAGGLTEKNLTQMTARLHDVFSMIETHQMTVAQGAATINANWSAFAAAGTNSLGLLDKSLTDIIALNDRFGTQSVAITQYIAGQMTNAQTGFTKALGITATAWNTLRADQLSAVTATGDGLAKLNADMMVQVGIIDATGLHSQAAATAVAGSLIGVVAANMAAGMSFIDAIRGIGPSVDALQLQLAATGYSGGAAFDFITQEVALANDAIAGPALIAVEGYTAGMVGLSNAGVLNQETFSGLSGQIAGTEAALVSQGYSGSAVMLAMKGDLQTVWELQQRYGYKVDDSTQALIDQGVESGLIGEQGKSDNQKILDVLMAIGEALGAKIPAGLKAMSDASAITAKDVQKNLDTIHTPAISDVNFTIHGNWDIPDRPDVINMSAGGVVYAAEGTNILPFTPRGTDTVPAMLTPGETVTSVHDTKTQAQSMAEVSRGLSDIRQLLAGQPAAMAVALKDAVVLLPRRTA